MQTISSTPSTRPATTTPPPILDKIKAPLFAINSADDEVNPPELGIMETEIKKVAKGRYILLPWSEKTSGHGTHSNPTIWGDYLKELLAISAPGALRAASKPRTSARLSSAAHLSSTTANPGRLNR